MKDADELTVTEKALVKQYSDLSDKIDTARSESTIRGYQQEMREIRDALVEAHDWTRKQANELMSGSQ